MQDQVNARERAADPSCTQSFTRRLVELAEQADEAMEGQWFGTNHVEASGSEAEFISWCSPMTILRLLREHELFRQALLAHPSRGVVDEAMVERAMDADAEEYGASIQASRVRRILEAAALPASNNADTLSQALHGLHTVLYSGDWHMPDDTHAQLEGIYQDAKNGIGTGFIDAALPAVPEDNRAELLADDIEAFHKAMDNLGFVPRTCDNGRHLSMYGRAMVGMTKFATMQREAAINSAAELVRSIPASAPQPNRPANAATPAHDQPEGDES